MGTGGFAANVSFGGRGSHMGSAMVPLDRALLSSVYSNRYTICNGLAAIWNANFDWGSDSQISHSRGGPGPLSNTMLLETIRVSLPNGTSLRPTILAGCTGVTYGQTDIETDIRTTRGNICRNRRNCWMPSACRLKIARLHFTKWKRWENCNQSVPRLLSGNAYDAAEWLPAWVWVQIPCVHVQITLGRERALKINFWDRQTGSMASSVICGRWWHLK